MLFPTLEGNFSFKVFCLRESGVSGRESLDRDVLLKAITSLYSTICTSRLLSGLIAFKASLQVTESIRGPSVSECRCSWTAGKPSAFCHLSCLLYRPGHQNIVLPFQILAIHCHLLSPFVSLLMKWSNEHHCHLEVHVIMLCRACRFGYWSFVIALLLSFPVVQLFHRNR